MILVLAGTLGYWGYHHIPWVEETVDLGYSLEAKLNPFLAAEIYLKELGISAKSHWGLGALDDLSDHLDTLLITSSRLSMAEGGISQLREWTQNGGHLITTAQSYYNDQKQGSADQLLDEIGVHRYPVDFEPSMEPLKENTATLNDETNEMAEDDSGKASMKLEEDVELLTPIEFEDVENPVWVNLSGHSNLVDTSGKAIFSAKNNQGVNLLQYQMGEGVLTVLSDDAFLRSHEIGSHDHAYFLYLLTRGSKQLWILYSGETPSLPALAWKHAALLLISAFVLLAFWLWRRSHRFGPLQWNSSLPRRQLMEHIVAGSNFNWRHKNLDKLIKSIREDIDGRMQLRHRNYRQLSGSQKATLLQDVAPLSKSEIVWTLTACSGVNQQLEGAKGESLFLRLIQNLQTIRKQL